MSVRNAVSFQFFWLDDYKLHPSSLLIFIIASMPLYAKGHSGEQHESPMKTCAQPLSLLLGHTDGSAPAAGSLGMLTTDTESPVVSQTTMRTNLLQSFQIIT